MKFSNIHIALIIFVSFVIPFSALYLIDDWVDGTKNIQVSNEFLVPQTDSNKTKVFLVGSSRMMMLDAFFIDEYILKNDKEVDVYNQGLSSDIPTRRLSILDKMISLEPKFVFIGVDIWNYLQGGSYKSSSPNSFSASYRCSNKLPEIQQIVNDLIPTQNQFFGLKLSNFDNPKLTTLKLLSGALPDSFRQSKDDAQPDDFVASLASLGEKQSWSFDNPDWRTLADDTLIQREINERGLIEGYSGIFNPNSNQAKALREIIETLQDNDIKVVLFTAPLNKFTYALASPCGIQDFEAFMENLSTDYNIKWYSFHDKYSNLNVWRDSQHIVWGKDGLGFSEDVAKMILKEILGAI